MIKMSIFIQKIYFTQSNGDSRDVKREPENR